MSKPCGYLIDAAARTITPTENYKYPKMLEHLPGGITLLYTFSSGETLYVDDEALLRPATCAFRFKPLGANSQPMMSNGIVSGREEEDFENDTYTILPMSLTIAELEAQIEWLTVPEALVWFRKNADDAATVIVTDNSYDVVSLVGDHLKTLNS